MESPRERVPHEIAEQFEDYCTNPDILELIARLSDEQHIDIPDPTQDETSFMAALQATFDFRKGKTREEIDSNGLSPEVIALTDKLIETYDMRRDTEPTNPDFDAALILGGAGITPLTRLEYALELQEQGKLCAPTLIMVGGERPVNEGEIARAKSGELARTDTDFDLSDKSVTTEFDLMRETAAAKLGIADDEWEYFTGDDATVPHGEGFQTEYRIARAYKDGQQILVTSAPMLDEDRYYPDGNKRTRANTIDSLLMIGETMGMGDGNPMRACVVTNAAFVRFQDADAKKALSAHNVDIETVGMTRAHSGLAEWQASEKYPDGDPAYYIGETLSAIRSTKFARDRLWAANDEIDTPLPDRSSADNGTLDDADHRGQMVNDPVERAKVIEEVRSEWIAYWEAVEKEGQLWANANDMIHSYLEGSDSSDSRADLRKGIKDSEAKEAALEESYRELGGDSGVVTLKKFLHSQWGVDYDAPNKPSFRDFHILIQVELDAVTDDVRVSDRPPRYGDITDPAEATNKGLEFAYLANEAHTKAKEARKNTGEWHDANADFALYVERAGKLIGGEFIDGRLVGKGALGAAGVSTLNHDTETGSKR